MSPSSDFRSDLQAAGLRVTTQVRLWTASTQAVHDALSAVGHAGLDLPIDPAGKAALYETRMAENHSHVVCRACGANADVWFGAVGAAAPAVDPSSAGGFLIDEVEVTFWGTCPDCQERGRTDAPADSQRLTVLAVRPDDGR